MVSLLWLIFIVLIFLWVIGVAVNWGAFIWALLVIAAVVFLINLISGLTRGRWH